jgi:hypothetical protein
LALAAIVALATQDTQPQRDVLSDRNMFEAEDNAFDAKWTLKDIQQHCETGRTLQLPPLLLST